MPGAQEDHPVITVAILVNGHPIYARSAESTGRRDDRGRTEHHVDDGSIVLHDPGEGAVALAVKLLGTIRGAK